MHEMRGGSPADVSPTRYQASPTVVAIPLRPHEAELIRRAVEELVEREGDSWTAANVREMLKRPLSVHELAAIAELV